MFKWIVLVMLLIPLNLYGGAKTVGGKKDYTRQQKIQRGDIIEKKYTTCRLKRIVQSRTGNQACIYQGGNRTFELVNGEWKYPYHIVHLNRASGALIIPKNTFHRSMSGEDGSIVINQAKRYDGFNASEEFIPVSCAENHWLYKILMHEKPVIHTLGE